VAEQSLSEQNSSKHSTISKAHSASRLFILGILL